MNHKVIYFILIFVALFFFSLGFFAANFVKTGPGTQDFANAVKTQPAQNSGSEKKLFVPKATSTNLMENAIFGIVKSMENDQISMEVYTPETGSQEKKDMRIIKIGPNTKIYRFTPKDPEVIKKEMEEFNQKLRNNTSGQTVSTLSPPESTIRLETPLSTIEVGYGILVKSDIGSEIKNAQEINATEIMIRMVVDKPASIKK